MTNENRLPTKTEAKAARQAERDAYSPTVKRLRLWIWTISMISWVPYFLSAAVLAVGLLLLMFAVFTPEFWQGAAHVGPLDFLAWIIATSVVISVLCIVGVLHVAALIALGAALIAQRKTSGGTALSALAFVSGGFQAAILVAVFVVPLFNH